MDLSKKTNPSQLPPTSTTLKPSELPPLSPNFPTEMKVEYIEEDCDTIKQENIYNQGIHQFPYNHHSSPHASPFIPVTPPTPSSQTSSLSFVSPFYPLSRFFPPIQPYPTFYPTTTILSQLTNRNEG